MNNFPVVLFSGLMVITAISIVAMVVLRSTEAVAPALVAVGVICGYVVKTTEDEVRSSSVV